MEYWRTRNMKMFEIFIIESTLSSDRQHHVDEQTNGSHEKYKAPKMDDEVRCIGFSAGRTITDNHIQQQYALPNCKSLVESEGEYRNVKNECASPCYGTICSTELLEPR